MEASRDTGPVYKFGNLDKEGEGVKVRDYNSLGRFERIKATVLGLKMKENGITYAVDKKSLERFKSNNAQYKGLNVTVIKNMAATNKIEDSTPLFGEAEVGIRIGPAKREKFRKLIDDTSSLTSKQAQKLF